ncbi:hypothetical protein PHISP_06721 [Aspergillus sp. HF37]|nr:hypothetical protein PHISP_06721 [Aspergillus sp. HF37]
MICHEGKPVAIREKLFKILTKAHQQCQHGGRDKTSAQVRRIYSWVPKELISRFVKICPTCQVRRGGSRLTPPNSRRSSPRLELITRSPKLLSPPISRRDSAAFGGPLGLDKAQPDYLSQFDDHSSSNGWAESHPHASTLHGRTGMSGGGGGGGGHMRSFSGASLGSLPNSLSATLDSFSGDLPVPGTHISYGAGFHGSSGHRGF